MKKGQAMFTRLGGETVGESQDPLQVDFVCLVCFPHPMAFESDPHPGVRAL